MNNNKESQMKEKLATINKANECSVLMKVLCEKLELIPNETTHQMFVEKFAELQKNSLEYQKELQEMYISTAPQKTKKKRIKKSPQDYTQEVPEYSGEEDVFS